VYKLKLLLLGEGGVGKTSLMRRFVYNQFSDDYISTIGVNVVKKTATIASDDVLFLIWDILGQKTHKSIHKSYYKGSQGAMVVCDLTRPETSRAMSEWISDLFDAEGEMPLVLLGNKHDLVDDGQIAVVQERLKWLADKYAAPRYITSAKTGENVEKAYEEIGVRIIKEMGVEG